MDEQHMDMPPGFRFHPTDEELVTHYLSRKIMDVNFDPRAIAEVDLNKCEPWDLPWKAKMGEKEWYFFCVKDRKYPTGLRTNRATKSGYWKATGKDKEIHRGKIQVGMKKTLVFYMGRAPRGEKTNWVMHEYRIETKNSTAFHNLSKAATNEWVICRVFHKSNAVNKAFGEETLIESSSSIMPPLMDTGAPAGLPEMAHVTCFSNGMEGHFNYSNLILSNTTTNDYILQNSINLFSKTSFADDGCKPEIEMASLSQETGLTTDVNTETSSVFSNHACDMGRCCLWNY